MLSRLCNLWAILRTGLWFVPTLMAVGAVGLAIIALNLDAGLPEERARQFSLHSGGPEDARNLLSSVFSSMITMATLVISITMVVLTLAATSRLQLLAPSAIPLCSVRIDEFQNRLCQLITQGRL